MEDKLVKILTHKLEEYGMPKFKDNHPALDVIQTMKDFGYIHIEDVLRCFDEQVNDKNGFRKAFTIGQVRQALENLGGGE